MTEPSPASGRPRTEQVTEVAAGDTVLRYTDGPVEGRDLPVGEGVDRLATVVSELAGRPLPQLCDAVVERMRPPKLQDDVALVAIRLR